MKNSLEKNKQNTQTPRDLTNYFTQKENEYYSELGLTKTLTKINRLYRKKWTNPENYEEVIAAIDIQTAYIGEVAKAESERNKALKVWKNNPEEKEQEWQNIFNELKSWGGFDNFLEQDLHEITTYRLYRLLDREGIKQEIIRILSRDQLTLYGADLKAVKNSVAFTPGGIFDACCDYFSRPRLPEDLTIDKNDIWDSMIDIMLGYVLNNWPNPQDYEAELKQVARDLKVGLYIF